MEAFYSGVSDAIQSMSGWELLAVILSLSYLILAIKEKISCWYAALASTAIYTVLFWDVNLLMDSALQVYYLIMAVYGWYQWRQHGPAEDSRPITSWPPQVHIVVLTLVVLFSMGSGYLLSHNTNASWPYLDSFTTWASVFTTFMVAKKVLENWLYWIIIDAFGIVLYVDRGLYLTALLFILYVVIALFGFLQWLKHYQQQLEQAQARQEEEDLGHALPGNKPTA